MADNNINVRIGANGDVLKSVMDQVSAKIQEAVGNWIDQLGKGNEQIVSDSESAWKKIFDNVKSAYEESAKAAEDGAGKLGEAGKQGGKTFGSSMEVLRGTLKRINWAQLMLDMAKASWDFAKESRDAFVKTDESFKRLEDQAHHAGASMPEAMKVVGRATADGLMTAADASEALQNLLAKGYDITQAETALSRLKDAAAYNRDENVSMGEAVVKAAKDLKDEKSELVDVSKSREDYAKAIGKDVEKLTEADKLEADYQALLKKTNAQVGDAAQYADSYKGSVERLNTKIFEMKSALGESLTPVFKDFNDAMSICIDSVIKPFIFLIGGTVIELRQLGETIGVVAAAVATRSFSGLGEELDNIGKKAEDAKIKLAGMLSGSTNTPSGPEQGAADLVAKKIKGYDAELTALKQSHELKKGEEKKFWEDKLKIAKAGSAEYRAITDKLNELKPKKKPEADKPAKKESEEKPLTKQLGDEAVEKREKADGQKMGSDERLKAEKAYVEAVKAAYGDKSKAYKTAVAEQEKALKAFADLEAAKAEGALQKKLAGLENEREIIAQRKALGLISAEEEISQTIKLEERKYQIEKAALDAKRNDAKLSLLEKEQINNQMQALEAKHAAAVQKLNHQTALNAKQEWDQTIAPVKQSFDSSMKGMLTGTMTFKQAQQNMLKAIKDAFANVVMNNLKKWTESEQAKTLAAKLGFAEQSVLAKTGAAESVSAKSGEALATIGANAGEAASGAASSQAAIPIAGPGLAAAAFAMVMAMVLGAKSSVPSAAGGFDIPGGVNPLTQLHEKEMVLPAKHADVIRGLAEGGTGSGAQPVNVNIAAVDARSVKRLFMDHGGALTDSIRAQARNFRTV